LREVLKEYPAMAQDMELNLAGIIGESILEELKQDPALSKVLKCQDYLPHQEVFRQCSQSALLLLILNRSDKSRCILPSKLYEYLAVGRPVLLLGPENGDAEIILDQLKAGDSLFYGDKEGIKKSILKYYQAYKQGQTLYQKRDISFFTRKNQALELIDFLNKTLY
jgi:glycosyltransferase involved in cell wall biosynthesis